MLKLIVNNAPTFDATLDAAVADVRERIAGHIGLMVEKLSQIDRCRPGVTPARRVAFLETLRFFSLMRWTR